MNQSVNFIGDISINETKCDTFQLEKENYALDLEVKKLKQHL